MTDNARQRISGISEEGQIVIFSVIASVLVVVLAVVVGSCIFFWKRRARRRSIAGFVKRVMPKGAHLARGPGAYTSYSTGKSGSDTAAGMRWLGSSRLHEALQISVPPSVADQAAPRNTHRHRLPGSLRRELYVEVASGRGGERRGSLRPRHRLRAKSLPPRLPFGGGGQDSASLRHSNVGRMPVPSDMAISSRASLQTAATRDGPRSRRQPVPPGRHFSFPPAATSMNSGWVSQRAPPPKERLHLLAADQRYLTKPSYDREDVLRTIQILRAKNDRIREQRLARLRGLDINVPAHSNRQQPSGVSPFHQRCFSVPSEREPDRHRRGATASHSLDLEPFYAQQLVAEPGRTKWFRNYYRSVPAAHTPPLATATGSSCCSSCLISSARGGAILHPRRGEMRRCYCFAAAATARNARETATQADGQGHRSRKGTHLPCRTTFGIISHLDQRPSTQSTAGTSVIIATVNSAPVARWFYGPQCRPAPPSSVQPPLSSNVLSAVSSPPQPREDAPTDFANARRNRFATGRQQAIDNEDDAYCDDDEDDDSLSSEPPPRSPCEASLNSSLTPELPASRRRRKRDSSTDAAGGGSTSVDEKYEFDMRTPG